MFEDVNVFSLGVGLCAITGMVIKVPEVDVLISGPSCKNFSLMRASRKAFAQCYEDGEGCSGETYTAGFKDAIASTGCRIAFFENVLGVSQRIVNKNGEVSEPNRGRQEGPPISWAWLRVLCCGFAALFAAATQEPDLGEQRLDPQTP